MSFSFGFTARSVSSAREKLAAVYAPACIKAVVETALAALPRGQHPTYHDVPTQPAENGRFQAEAKAPAPRQPQFIGVHVEAYGHIDDGHGRSAIDRFIVQPLFD